MPSQSEWIFHKDNLVLYKNNPARVTSSGTKVSIDTMEGETVLVRPKDLCLLHPGPVTSLAQLTPLECNAGEVRELLDGTVTTLKELTELLYGSFTCAGAWAAYQLVQEGLYFCGTLDEIRVRTRDEFEHEATVRKAKAGEKEAWQQFIEGVRQGKVQAEDKRRLQDLEQFALGKSKQSRILKELNIAGTPENAHKLLLTLGQWDEQVNPYIERLGFTRQVTYPGLSLLPAEERLDLTHLAAFAIDDAGNTDPDDAISLEGENIWVHVADVAALVQPDTEVDLFARAAAANHYLPEQTLTMLPPEATPLLGLGLQAESPALSFCISLDSAGAVAGVAIHTTRVKVTRLTYAEAQERLQQEPFKTLCALTARHCAWRRAHGAVQMRFPEVKIKVREGRVCITPLPPLDSQDLVAEAMLMAGTAAGRWAAEHGIPLPYTTQPAPESMSQAQDWAGLYAFRKQLSPSTISTAPGLHAGLGLTGYSRATSPLRRYLDLLTHQQLRAHLAGKPVLDEQAISDRIGVYSAVSGPIQKLERLSNQHWTLVWLLQNPGWSGTASVVDRKGSFYTVLIPDLAMETGMTISRDLALNEEIRLRVSGVDLPVLSAHFKVL